MPPQGEPKNKKKKGCLIGVGIFILLLILVGIFSDGNKNSVDKTYENTDSIAVVEETVIDEPISTVDSAKMKELAPLFTEKLDEFKGVTWITPKSAPKYRNSNGFYTYFCTDKDGKPQNLRLVIQYFADDWLFIKNYTFLIDGEVYNFTPANVETDNNANIWEWTDTSATEYEVKQILKAMRNAKEVKVRFNGRQYQKDKTLTAAQIKAVTQPIEYYEAMGGEF